LVVNPFLHPNFISELLPYDVDIMHYFSPLLECMIF
jgi:hypothetical protein